MSRKKGRTLRPGEKALWQKVTDTITPLVKPTGTKGAIGNLSPEKPAESPDPVVPRPSPAPAIKHFRLGEKTGFTESRNVVSPSISEQIAAKSLQMDKKSFTRLKQGKLKPEARLDLHGMTLNHAHPVLNRFILDAHARGLRLVLVITGKGKGRDPGGPIPERVGVLRHQVPQWLHSGVLQGSVLQVVEAHRKHGGGGAWYVYLRRKR